LAPRQYYNTMNDARVYYDDVVIMIIS